MSERKNIIIRVKYKKKRLIMVLVFLVSFSPFKVYNTFSFFFSNERISFFVLIHYKISK